MRFKIFLVILRVLIRSVISMRIMQIRFSHQISGKKSAVHSFAFIFVLIAIVLTKGLNAEAQVLSDTARITQVRNCIADIYNCRFTEAEKIVGDFEKSYPASPVPALIKGMIIYWTNYPLLPWSAERATYEKELKLCITLSEKKNPGGDEAEYLLADMCARGLLMLFYSDNDMSSDVFSVARSSYRYLRECFNYTSVYPDFYFFTGIYNYYREKYPEIHPIYRPFTIIFPRGDIKKGIEQLQTAFHQSIVLNAEAGNFLSWVYSGYEFDNESSIVFNKQLCEKYPENLYYLANYIKYLLLGKKYDEARKLIEEPGDHNRNSYFRAQLLVFSGILQEKKYMNPEKAREDYETAIKSLTMFGDYSNEFKAYAYFGLSRVGDPGKSGEKKKKYRREALKYAEFSHMNFDD